MKKRKSGGRAVRPATAAAPWVRTGEPLFWLSGAAVERREDTSYFFDATKRRDQLHWVLQLTLSGQGFFEKARRRVALPAGWAFLHTIPGDFRYGFAAESAEPYELVFVSFSGPKAEEWCRRIVDVHGHVLHFGQPNALAPLMLSLARLKEARADRDRYLVSGQLYQLLMGILSTLSQSRLAMEPLVSGAIEQIVRHAADRTFDISKLSASAGCSREHLARQFRAAIGVSPSDYLLQQRLRLGAQALRNGDEKLETVAQSSGFAGANYFCRAFKKRLGVTPADFRRRLNLAMP